MQVSAAPSANFSQSADIGLNGRQVSTGANDERISQAHKLQNTFTAVLAQFGREGYASANPVASDAPLDTSISSSWSEWFDQVGRSAYRELPAPNAKPGIEGMPTSDQLKQDYGQLLLDAYNKGGYVQPKAFLELLSPEQLTTLQTVHRLAHPIDVAQLQEEGAINLLIPPPAHVDFNGDGLTQIGIAQKIGFPDSSTSTEVRDAWEQSTANLSPMERMHYALQMKLPLMTANIHVDANGQFIHRSEPGDADWTNPMASPNYSFRAAAQQWLDYLDAFKNQIPPDQYLRDHQFWSEFGNQLKAHGAP